MGNTLPLPKTIAVDGPASSGKSSVSYAVAQRLNYIFVDTGAFYRAITVLALRDGIAPHNHDGLTQLAERTQLDITPASADKQRQYTVLANQMDITPLLHSRDVDAHVSEVAAVAGVRAALLNAQRNLAERRTVIMAGRDIGTVVLPDADLKIYIDASLDKRAERRWRQRLAQGEPADLDVIRAGLRQRDAIDSGREVAPLVKADDAVHLDTSGMTFDEAVEAVLTIVRQWGEDHCDDTST